jgi:hypothetical protein
MWRDNGFEQAALHRITQEMRILFSYSRVGEGGSCVPRDLFRRAAILESATFTIASHASVTGPPII